MQENLKKTWHKPELIVIVRSHPEENVLLSCKIGSMNMNGPSGRMCVNYNGNGCHEKQSS